MLRPAASLALSILIVASCATTSSPTGTFASTALEARPSAIFGPVARTTADQEPSPAPTPMAIPTPSPVTTPTPSPITIPTPSPVPTPLPGHLVVDAQLVGPGIGWVETDRALLVTHDDGQTWLDATPNILTYGLDAVDGQTAYVASDELGDSTTTVRIYGTTNGGRTWRWTNLTSMPRETANDCGCGGHGVLIDAVSSLVVFVDVVVYSGTDGEGHDVFRSLDGGVTWKSLSLSIEAHGAPADLAIHFLTADIGTVLFDQRLFSTDSGWGHWTESDQGWPVTFLDRGHWIIPNSRDPTGPVQFAESEDAGRTWTMGSRTVPVSPPLGAGVSLAFIDATTWVALISRTLDPLLSTQGPAETWISTDAGKTWSFVGNQPSSNPRSSTFVDRFHAWVLDDAGGLATTSDGGATWSQIGP